MNADESLLMALATPDNVDEACRTLEARCDPASCYLKYLDAKAQREPHNAAFLGRVAGNVRKVEGMK